MQDLAVLRDVDGPRRVEHAVDVALPHFLVLDRDDALRVEAPDVAARDAGVDGADLHPGHQLGLLDGPSDRGHRRLDVDDHTLAQAARRMGADADDVDAVGSDLAHDAANLGGADVQSDDDLTLLLRHDGYLLSASVAAA